VVCHLWSHVTLQCVAEIGLLASGSWLPARDCTDVQSCFGVVRATAILDDVTTPRKGRLECDLGAV
jgi:hypothetical protein